MQTKKRRKMVSIEEKFSVRGAEPDWHWTGQMFEDMVEDYVAKLPEGREWRIVEDGGRAFRF